MSQSDTNHHQQRIDFLEGRVSDEYLNSIKTDTANPNGSAEADALATSDAGAVEALRAFDRSTLDDVEAMQETIEQLNTKLDRLGTALPSNRREEVKAQIEALSDAIDAHSSYRKNTPEALAARIEVSR
ncbi:hypothetical protein [Haloarcula amylolytica]|uniref:hypothetical protein n=1 Tax=Haloarcula amylolytica TaxID=396317 RepID=UPI003C77760C